MEMCLGKDENGNQILVEKSGSCAIVTLIVGDMCYVVNVGDSRAVMSANAGQDCIALSQDHKPSEKEEYLRIIKAGGNIYQTTTLTKTVVDGKTEESELMVGPIRVLPGRLSVSKTFGDPDAKYEFRGGNPKVVVCEPDI